MPDDRRQDAATASTGAVLLAGGGGLRHAGVRHGFPAKKPKIHAIGMLRAPHGKRLFWGGSALGALGLPPLAVGTTRLVRGNVDKADRPLSHPKNFDEMYSHLAWHHGVTPHDLETHEGLHIDKGWAAHKALHEREHAKHQDLLSHIHFRVVGKADDQKKGFWREGLHGAREALGERAQSYKEPVPAKIRAGQLGFGAGVGALGSFAARAALGRRGNALKPVLTPVAGGLAATASVPLSNHYVTRKHPDYEITPAGVRRKKKVPVKPSKMSSQYRPMPRSLQQDIKKAESYQGARTPYFRQRAAITAAGHPPVIGPFTQAAAAARYAPPGQERKQALRQYGMASAAGLPIGVGGAYAGAHLAARSKTAEGIANDAMRAKHAVHTAARRAVGLKEKPAKGPGRLTTRLLESKAGKPFRTKAGAVGGAAGFIGAKMAAGGVLGQAAITMNQNDQRRYNKTHHIEKSEIAPGVFRAVSRLDKDARREVKILAGQRHIRRLSGEKFGHTNTINRLVSENANRALRSVHAMRDFPTEPSDRHPKLHYAHYVSREHRQILDRVIGNRRLKRNITIHVHPDGEHGGGGMAAPMHRSQRSQVIIAPSLLEHPDSHGIASLHHTVHHELTHAEKTRATFGQSVSGQRREKQAQREEARADEMSHRWHGVTRTGHADDERDRHFMGMQRKLRAQRGTRGTTPIAIGKVDQTKREKHALASAKRRSAALQVIGGSAGLTSLGLLAARKREPAILVGTVGSGVGGVNALLGSHVQRQEAKAVDPVKKRLSPLEAAARWHSGLIVVSGKLAARPTKTRRVAAALTESLASDPTPLLRLGSKTVLRKQDLGRAKAAALVHKAGLEIKGDKHEHAEYIRRYGDRGSLPKNLSREERMKAYEARYVHHGGDKANKWSRRATTGERLKNTGLAVGTAGGAGWLATRGRRGAKLLAKHPHFRSHAETTAVAGATVGGAGEMLAGYAHRKQSSYANSPGGVAASALRRMRAYTPEEGQ